MITIQKNTFDFQVEQEAFAQTLYGRWDTFHRNAFEKVVEDVLSRYDTPDALIRIETLDLDLGTLTEENFYEQFPRVLARKLDEIFSAYLAHKDARPGDIRIIPLTQSLLDTFSFYLTKGYLPWEEETRRRNLSDLLQDIIRSDAAGLLRFLQEEGGRAAVRERLAFQFSDADLERLTAVVVPSDSQFINAYVRFLVDSHKRLQRPDLTVQDYRDGVWLVVWTYLLAESKGYYSRKQLVLYTLQQLSARYMIPLETLLEWMTAGLKALVSVRTVIPELLLILSELREEQRAESRSPARTDLYSTDEWIAILSVPESCRRFLKNLTEEAIYRCVERVIPSEHRFVIRYAQALDKEKERGMLEGKAGEEFRLLKWEFIFQVILRAPEGSFHRLQFAYEVLRQLAAHYNLQVMELLAYFYRSLASGDVRVDHGIRELIYALFLQHRKEILAGTPLIFPEDLKETLGNIHLCRLFLQPLPEEKIHLLVKEIIPAESPFIIRYAQTLDKGKERNAFEGKAGAEFRILKWEFIFLIVLSAPLSYFNRKQFTRAVLRQLAAHYNLGVKELIVFFYEHLHTGELALPEEICEVIIGLYEEMVDESPESFLVRQVHAEMCRYQLEALIREGRMYAERPLVSVGEVYEYMQQLARTDPALLLEITGEIHKEERVPLPVRQAGTGIIFAFLLRFVIQSYGLAFSRKEMLIKRLDDIGANRRAGDATLLRLLLYYCIRNRMDAFQKTLDEFLRPEGIPAESRIAVESGTAEGERKEAPAERISGEKTSSEEVSEEENRYPLAEERKKEHFGDKEEEHAEGKMIEEESLFPYRWLKEKASPSLRLLIEEVLFLMASDQVHVGKTMWLSLLVALASPSYRYYSTPSLWQLFWEWLQTKLTEAEQEALVQAIHIYRESVPGFAATIRKGQEGGLLSEGEKELVSVYIRNAGLVLLAPFFPRLFSMLNLLDEKKRLSERAHKIKAIYLMQYLVTEEERIPEYELFLNKLLTGYEPGDSFPAFMEIEEREQQILVSLLDSVRQNWSKMKNTSIRGFRNSFLLREGVLEEKEDHWLLTVEPRAYDVLLDTLPWSYSPVKWPWMAKPIFVKWL